MPEPLINTRHTIVAFTVHDLPSVDQAGGKALALIQMTAAGMPVPPGFVLTREVFSVCCRSEHLGLLD